MLEQYRKTLVGMQIFIAAVTLGILAWSRLVEVAAVFFVVMQVAAVLGAAWGARLRDRIRYARGEFR